MNIINVVLFLCLLISYIFYYIFKLLFYFSLIPKMTFYYPNISFKLNYKRSDVRAHKHFTIFITISHKLYTLMCVCICLLFINS